MAKFTFIADVELFGDDQDNPSLIFSASVLEASVVLGMGSSVRIKCFGTDDVPRLGIAIPHTKKNPADKAEAILNEALVWFDCKLACQEYSMTTKH